MRNVFKNPIFTFVLGGIIVASIIGVYAINANEITYNDTTVAEELDILYSHTDPALRPVLLWTNENPTAAFAAQTISLDLSEYKYVIIVVKQNTNGDYYPRCNIILPVSASYENGWEPTIGTNGSKINRLVMVDLNGIWISDATGSSGTYNNVDIPYKIYGIKGDLEIDLGINE